MKFVHNDGGRKAAGYQGDAGDCVARSIAIASGLPYQEVYEKLADGKGSQRLTKRAPRTSRSARNGIHVRRKWFKDYMRSIGFVWVPTMKIGSGCKVHLADGELPNGRLVVAVSKHYTAVIDGVIHDTHDPQRPEDDFHWYGDDGKVSRVTHYGGRCVYGYWKFDK